MATNYEALLGRGGSTTAGASPGAVAPASKYEALLGRGGSSTNPAPAAAPVLNAADQKTLKSFNTLDAGTRTDTLNRLTTSANAGDTVAAHKLSYLVPVKDQNIPAAPDYVDHSLGGVLYRAQDPIISSIVGGISGGNGVAATPSDENTIRIAQRGGGTKTVGVEPMGDFTPTLRDQAIAGAGARFGGLINPSRVVKGAVATGAKILAKNVAENTVKTAAETVAPTFLQRTLTALRGANHTGLEGAAFGAADAATSNNQYNSTGDAVKGIVGGAAAGYGTGATLHLGTGAVRGAAHALAQYVTDPIQLAAHERVIATLPKDATRADYVEAVKAETKAIKSDPVQKQAILNTYKTQGSGAITATTGQSKEGLAAHYNSEAKMVAPQYLKTLEAVGKSTGLPLDTSKLDNAVKKPSSILEKFDRKASTDRPTDLVRATMKLPKDAASNAETHIQAVVDQMKQHGYDVYTNPKSGQPDITNRFSEKTPGYKDIALKFTRPDSPIVHELQLLQPAMAAVKDTKAGHGIYDTLKAVSRWKAEHGDNSQIRQLEADLMKMTDTRYTAALAEDNPSSMRPASTSALKTSGVKGSADFSPAEITSLKGFLNNLKEPTLASRAVSSDIAGRLSSVIEGSPSKSTIADSKLKSNEKVLPKVNSVYDNYKTFDEFAAASKNDLSFMASKLGVDSPEHKGATNELRSIFDAGKPIAQDVHETATDNGTNETTRSHHFDEALQNTFKGVQDSPGYKQELANRFGDSIQSHEETYATAKRLGPIDDKVLMNFKQGDAADTVTTTRAHATVEAAARDLQDLRLNGTDPSDPAFQASAERFGKLLAGYKMMTAESGRSLNIQGSFVDTAIKLQEKVAKIEQETKGVTPEIRQKLVNAKITEAERELNGGRTLKEKEAAVSAARVKAEKSVPAGATKLEKAAIVAKAVSEAETQVTTKLDKVKNATNSILKMVAEYSTATKLTSPLTHVVNIGSNLLTLPLRSMENALTLAQKAAKGEADAGGIKYAFGAGSGWSAATHQFAADMKNALTAKGYDTEVAKGEIKPAIPGKVGHYIRTPFNFLSAADNFFKGVLSSNELHQQAYSSAYKEGWRGSKLAERIRELVTSPTDEMLLKADNVAKEYTFNNDAGPISSGITKILGKVPLLRLLIPFVKTPSNLASFQARRSAFGIFSPHNIQELAKGGASREEAISRLAVGTGMSIAGVMAVANLGADNIVGAAPTTPGEKDTFYTTGKKPYSVKIGNNWVQFNRFQPVGMYLTQAVNLRDALSSGNSKTAGNIFTSLVVGTAKGIADLPFVSGVSNVIAALNDPTNQTAANKAVGGLVTGLIPNVSRDIASAGDNTQRSAKTITDQVELMVPGLREQVAPRKTVFGIDQANAGSSFQRGFVKIVTQDNSSNLEKALAKLSDETQYYVSQPRVNAKVHGAVLTPEQFDKYQTLSGQKFATRLEQAVSDASFNSLSTDDKTKTLQAIVASSRADAANELLGKKATAPYKAPLKQYK